MEETISVMKAKRHWTRLLREVAHGASFVITCKGKPLARITPPDKDSATADRAWRALLTRLEAQRPRRIGDFERAALYDR